MSIQPDTSIQHLDFTEYGCACPCHPCPNRATHVVHIHALHRCNDAGLLYGDRVELRCFECVLKLCAEVRGRLKNRWGVGMCETCGAPVADVIDVVREIEELAH